jgi:plasmid stabilization system protein ParE
MKWGFHPKALEEYREAALYYAGRDPALALKFLDAVEDAIRRILESPERYRIVDGMRFRRSRKWDGRLSKTVNC